MKPKNPSLRELFIFGGLLRCPHCNRLLCAYRVKEKYIYYECKNPQCDFNASIPQSILVEQLKSFVTSISLAPADVEKLRENLLKIHEKRSGNEIAQRTALNEEYENVQREIGDVFAQRKEAEAMGILDSVDLRLSELRSRKDSLQAQLNSTHEKGDEWIEKAIRTFELLRLLPDAVLYGSARTRDMILRGIASKYSVEGRKLVVQPRAPFRQSAQKDSHSEWWAGKDSNLRRRKPPDLQSGAFDRFATDPITAWKEHA